MKLITLLVLSFLVQGFAQPELLTILGDEAEFQFSDVAGLEFYFDDVDNATSWADLSGNDRTMTFTNAPTINTAAKNGNNTVTFNGTDEVGKLSAFTFNRPETVYIVFKPIAFANDDIVFDGDGNTSGSLYMVNGNFYRPYAGTFPSNEFNIADGEWVIMRVTFNDDNSIYSINGETALTGDTGTGNMGGFTLARRGGSLANSNIEVGCVLGYSVTPTDSEDAQIFSKLNAKWAVY